MDRHGGHEAAAVRAQQGGGFHFPALAGEEGPVRRREWPFYLDRRQRARLRWLHEAWGDDAVIQIYWGGVRIRGECGDWRFPDDAQLRLETARRHGYAVLRGRARGEAGGGTE